MCGAALGLRKGKTPLILVTKDIVVRVKAQMLGIQAEDFTTEQAPISEEQYTGRCEVFVAEKKFEDFKASPHNCVCGLRPIFCPIHAVIKGGNTYSIPALL